MLLANFNVEDNYAIESDGKFLESESDRNQIERNRERLHG